MSWNWKPDCCDYSILPESRVKLDWKIFQPYTTSPVEHYFIDREVTCFDEAMALAVISLKWVHREIHGKPPSPRQGHSACLIGDVAYVFGGIRSVDWPKKGNYFFRDLYQLHLFKRMQWEKVKQKGEIPKGRYGHHMCVIEHNIYLFGGKHELKADRCLPGLHVYDTEKKMWSQPPTSGTEPVAYGSTSSVVGNRVYVYGGLVDGQAVDDVHCFDSENQWWVKLTVQGVPPSPRCDSASTAVGNEIFVFGGTAGTDQWFNDIHVFNAKKLLWKELNKTDGEKPTPRGGHCFLAHVDKDVYVFGGSNDSNTTHPTLGDLFKFSLDKRKWKRPFYGGCPPAKRSGHATIIHRNKLIVIGGSNEDTDFNDVHIAKLINPSKRQPLKVPAGDMHDFLDTINSPDPRPMVVDGEDAEAHFHEKEDPEPMSEEAAPAEGSEMDQSNDQQTGSHASGSRDGSVAGSQTDLKESPGKSVHFQDDGDGKQDAASLSSSAGSLASSAGSLSSSASSASSSSQGSSASSASSDSRGSDVQGSNNNNSNNNNAVVGVRSGMSEGVSGGIVQGYSEKRPEGGTENATTSMSEKGERKGKSEAADESGNQLVSQNNQVGGSSIQSTQLGNPKLAPIADTEPEPSVSKQGKKAGPKKKKPKKEKGRKRLEDDTQHSLPAEHRSYPPMESYPQRFQEEIALNHHQDDRRTPDHQFNAYQAQEKPESDKDSESGSGSGSESSSEEDSDGDDDDDDSESENSDDGDGDNQSMFPEKHNMNGYDEPRSYRPTSQERPSESSRDEAESEDEDGSGSDDDSGSDDEESGSDTGSESGSGDDSESDED